MRQMRRLQSEALALAAVCAMQATAPGLLQAQATQAPAPPASVPQPAPTAATQPAVTAPAQTTPGAPVAPIAATAADPTPPPYPATPTAQTEQPQVPAAAEPTSPPAYVEPMQPPAEAAVTDAAPTIDEELVTEPKSKVPSYVMWAAGGASLITGAVLGITALSAKTDFDDSPSYSAADRVEGRAFAADVAFGLSAVLLVTGTVFYFLPDSHEPRPTAANPTRRPTGRVQVAPMLGRMNGGAVSIQF